jgi:succinate-semialdehyde dehydrogenase / glutarate-semialdehyde dehydrogenase
MFQSPLLKNISGYIAGRWTGAQSGKVIAVINPATGEDQAAHDHPCGV